ncbi:MAG: GDSL family lipase [Phycisphaeraceae bacterium]|nr:GDSL family lipase [Phycisphaeraceae bacterium]
MSKIATRSLCLLCLIGSTAMAQTKPLSIANFHKRAQAGEKLNVVFLGGSLTWGANASDPNQTSYRALMGKYLIEKYPKAHITNHDAAIGGTGSNLGIFRLERDVFAKNPDLVFVDFTINDGINGSDKLSLEIYESLLRMMLERDIPVVQVLLSCYGQLGKHYDLKKVPRYNDHIKIAKAYNTGVGDTLQYIQNAYKTRKLDLDEVWSIGRDKTHPDDAGYRLYFEAVRDGYEEAVKDKRVTVIPDKPVFGDGYMNPKRHILVDMQTYPKGWQRSKTYRTSLWFDGLSSRWMGDVLAASAKRRKSTEPLVFDFQGTFVGIFGEYNGQSVPFRVYIDDQLIESNGSEFWERNTSRFSSSGSGNLFAWTVLAKELEPGKHTLKIEPIFMPSDKEGELHIESICVAGPTK